MSKATKQSPIPSGADSETDMTAAAPGFQVFSEESPADIENRAVNSNRRMERNTSKVRVAIPYGKLVPAEAYADVKYDHTNNWHLDSPEKLLIDPKPGYHYAWPAVKGDKDGTYAMKFQSRKSMGIYKPVDKSRLKPNHGAPVLTHEGNDDTGIYWYMHQLVEIPPDAWKEHYSDRARAGMAEMARREESHLESVEQTSQGFASGTLERTFSER